MSQLTNAQLRAEVEKAEARFEETYPDIPSSGSGRRATIRSMAMKHVAEKLGIPMATVQTKWRRASTNPRRATPREKEHFNYLGVDVSESYRRMLGKVLNAVQSAQRHLSSAKSAMAAMAATNPFPEPKLKQWLGELDELFQRTKGMAPVGVCPWCKNTKSYRDNCPACFGTGYMLRHQAHAVPERLKEPGLIIQNGHERRLKNLAQAPDRDIVPVDEQHRPGPILLGDADNGDPLPW